MYAVKGGFKIYKGDIQWPVVFIAFPDNELLDFLFIP